MSSGRTEFHRLGIVGSMTCHRCPVSRGNEHVEAPTFVGWSASWASGLVVVAKAEGEYAVFGVGQGPGLAFPALLVEPTTMYQHNAALRRGTGGALVPASAVSLNTQPSLLILG